MTITAINEIGGGKHLRLTLSRDGRFVTAMYFHIPPRILSMCRAMWWI